MTSLSIHCASCDQAWNVTNRYSLYEQQAVESCPCPHCGAYTLCCQMPTEPVPFEKARAVGGWRARSAA